jgi:predicted RNase H-like HicB family nuclease
MGKVIKKNKKKMFQLSVIFIREGRSIVAYAPALDLSTCGDTLAEAKRNFKEAAILFFETLEEWGTTEKVLKELGWQKDKNNWQPPVVISPKAYSVGIPVHA